MPTKLKFKFTNHDEDEDVRQAYPMQRRRASRDDEYDDEPVVHRAVLARRERREPKATEERYVRRVTVQEVSTNDSTVSLHGTLRSTYDFMQLLFAVGMGGGCLYVLGDAVSFGIKTGMTLGVVVAAYMFVKHLRSDGGESGKGR